MDTPYVKDTLHRAGCSDGILERLGRITPQAARQWGKMDPAQALAHCALALEASTGDATLKRPLIAKLIGRFFRSWLLGDKPFSRNSPTHPMLVTKTPKEFERERTRLMAAVRKFQAAGPEVAARYPHALLGRMTGDEWGEMQWKHLDHHLRQFGV